MVHKVPIAKFPLFAFTPHFVVPWPPLLWLYYNLQPTSFALSIMTFWALASRQTARSLGFTRQQGVIACGSVGATRQMSVADKDNILPVSYWLLNEGGLWRVWYWSVDTIQAFLSWSCGASGGSQSPRCMHHELFTRHPINSPPHPPSNTTHTRPPGTTSSNAPPKYFSWPKYGEPFGSPEKSLSNPK